MVSEVLVETLDSTVVGLVSSVVKYSLIVLPADGALVSLMPGVDIEVGLEILKVSDAFEISSVLASVVGVVDLPELCEYSSGVIVLEVGGEDVFSVVTPVKLVDSCICCVPVIVDDVDSYSNVD